MSAADATERRAWNVLLGVAGAATGIVAFVYFVGGVIEWERLYVLRLPATQGVEPLPRELLLLVGARALAWPLTLGFLAILAVHALCRLPPPPGRRLVLAADLGLVVDDKEATRRALEAAGAEIVPGRGLDFRDPWGNNVQVVQYDEVQFSKTERVLRGMGLELGKSEQALAELRDKGLA